MSYLSKIFNIIAGSGLLALGYSHYRTLRELKRLRKANTEKSRITSELHLASQIQQSMMPIGHKVFDKVDIYGTLLPAREMGGDLFDHMIRDGKFYFCVGDVCGSTSVWATSVAREPPPPCSWRMPTRCCGLSHATKAILPVSYNPSMRWLARIISLVRSSPSSSVCST